jgi:beta-glucosidase
MRDVIADLAGSATVTKLTVADDLSNLDEVKAAATDADVVVIMAGLVATEGEDQPDMNMLNEQNRLIAEIGPVNPTTVVVLKDSNPVLMPWIDAVPAVIEVWNQGEEDGHAVADLLFGVVNPSGKLPTTYPRSAEDTLVAGRPERYPGIDEGDGYPVIRYSEGLQVGYRWFQAQGIAPLFPFGHGLSYTTFEVSDVSVDAGQRPGWSPVMVRATVTNTGDVAGAEVVQVYLGLPPAANQPPKRLVGIQKVRLEPGAGSHVEIVVDPSATNHPLSVWSRGEHTFVTVAGEYTVYAGTSSEDTPFQHRFTVSW